MPVGIDKVTYRRKKAEIVKVMNEMGRELEKFSFGVFHFLFTNDDEDLMIKE